MHAGGCSTRRSPWRGRAPSRTYGSSSSGGGCTARAAIRRRPSRCSSRHSTGRSRRGSSSSPATPRTCARSISVDDRKLQDEWTQRGLDLGEREPDAAYWAGPLLNNLGWTYVDAGDYDRALELFERALEARRQDPQNRAPIAWAQYAVGQTLRILGRASEAVPVLEEAAATLPEDADIRQELAEARAAAV